MKGKSPLDYAAYFVLRIVVCTVQALPLERCDRFCSAVAYLFAHHLPLRRKLIDSNLRLIYPQWSDQQIAQTRQEMWRHLLLMICEIAHAPRKIHRTNWRQYFQMRDARNMVGLVLDERPAILVTGHFGNFELAGFITGMFGMPSTTIARPLDNRYVHEYFSEFRSLNGQHLLPKEGSSGDVQKLLDQGGTLALLADQYGGPKGCWANFLGHPASCHKALALFTLTSKAPMCVSFTRRMDRPLTFEMGHMGIADPRQDGPHLAGMQALTQWYNDRLGQAIHRWPGQYWWVHRRWRGEPPVRKKPKLESSSNSEAAATESPQ